MGADLGGGRWRETAKARLAAEGNQGPDLRTGNVDIAGCVSRRLPHLQPISLEALRKWPLWSLDIKNAVLRATRFDREVYLRDPCKWKLRSIEIAGARVWVE